MADLEDVVEAICKGDYTTAQKRLEIIIRDILNKHEYPGVKIEKVWIRPCNGEICIDVVFAPSFGRHASIPMYILVELCDTIWDISRALGLGITTSPFVRAEENNIIISIHFKLRICQFCGRI